MYNDLILSNDGKKLKGVRNKNIISAEIPYGVIEIGYNAFYGCESLREVIIPNSVVRIGKDAFCGCKSLRSLVIPNSVTTIGYAAFSYCYNLDDIEIPESVQEIGEYAFSDTCGWFRRQKSRVIYINDILYKVKDVCPEVVIVRKGTRAIADGAFSHCNTLQSVIIPDSVQIIGVGSFQYCNSIKTVKLPDSIKIIGDYAFSDCTSLSEIHIPEIENIFIGGSAFKDTRWLKEQENDIIYINDVLYKLNEDSPYALINIRPGTKRIAPYAFCRSKYLHEVNIPESVMEIGDGAFNGCPYLKSIYIPHGIKCIDDYTFEGCTSLEYIDIPNTVESIGKYAFKDCSSLQVIDIPKSVKTIEDQAFFRCTSLYSIDIPGSVISVGCNSFDQTRWYEDLPDGVVYLNKVLYKTKGIYTNNSLEIKEGTKCIAVYAIGKNDFISSVVIPDSMVSIGNVAFKECKSLKAIHSHIENIEDVICEDSFDIEVLKRCTLYIPSGTRWHYKHHPVFRHVNDIEIDDEL